MSVRFYINNNTCIYVAKELQKHMWHTYTNRVAEAYDMNGIVNFSSSSSSFTPLTSHSSRTRLLFIHFFFLFYSTKYQQQIRT